MLAVHAELASEYPIGLRARNDLVERNQRVVVGVEIPRVLITFAGEENVLSAGRSFHDLHATMQARQPMHRVLSWIIAFGFTVDVLIYGSFFVLQQIFWA